MGFPIAKNIFSHKEKFLLWAIIFIGFIFRLRQYLYNRSLWLDEAMLANNIIAAPLRLLLFEKLESDQAAPPGFLLAIKAVIKFFGSSDIIIRLPVFLSGVLILFIAYLIARQVLKTTLARAGFLSFISVSPVLVYYSSEFKQYSLDAFLALLLVFVGLNYKKWKYGIWIFGFTGVVVPWFSHPSIFVLAAVGSYDLFSSIRRRDYRLVRKLVVMIASWVAAFSLYYFLSIREVSSNGFLQEYWSHGFAPFPPLTFEDFYWYLSRILEMAFISFQQLGPVPVVPLEGWLKIPNLFISLLIVAGSIFLFLRSRRNFGILIGSIIITLCASILKLYPFSGRLIIFLVPILILIVSFAIDELAQSVMQWRKFLAGALVIGVVLISLIYTYQNFSQPINNHNIKGALSFLEKNFHAGDVLAISAWSQPAFAYYSRFFDLHNLPVSIIVDIKNDESQFMIDLCSGEVPGRVWILYSHRFSERLKLLDPLSRKYPLLASWEDGGAGVYLFDMSNACSENFY